MKHFSFILFITLFAFIIAINAQTTKDVTTPLGTIRGYLSNGGQGYEFRGIKYTNPYSRWKHSQVASNTFDLFDAKHDSPACDQACHLPPHTCPMSYDELSCLGLNVFIPKDATSTSNLPVAVYLHGGNYFQGANDTPLYNGTVSSSIGNTILVIPNYRLGILGFYRDDELGIWGNYGIVDQIQALKWVQQNIRSFGGDVDNVTVYGQSAGAGSTAVHLISKYSEGLFHKAILHSNPFAIPFRSIKTKAGLNKAYRKNSGCSTRECLLGLTSAQIIDAQVKTATDLDAASGNILSVFIPFNPYVETPGQEPQDPEYPGLVPYQPHEAWLRGLVKNVPIMIGYVKQESDVFIYEAFEKELDDTGYGIFGFLVFGDERNKKIQAKYPPTKGIDNRDGLCTIGSEFIFECAGRNATRGAIMTSVKRPVYTYVFDSIYNFNNEMWGPDFAVCNNRVCHAGDLPSLFYSAQWMFEYDAQDQELALQMNYYWTNFMHSSNPNIGPNQSKLKLSWEQYASSGRSMVLSKKGNYMVNDYMGEACAFWDTQIGYFL